ncbi:MarR family winged helix-turn-helix transcriptional regulator [Georgenia sunbinii]|uniref:MarR family winged helix-turn-helix transcriptional regulator n=1 Tax=Georgenia sunbinii TaxID=3117728 RepID=UPI002F2653EE
MAERADLIVAVTEAQASITGLLAHEQSELILSSPLTMAQLKMLMLLRIHGATGGHELATHLRVSMPSVSGMVDRLATRGLVERREDPADRRVRLVALSDRGSAMIAEHEAVGREISDEIFADLDVEDLRALARGLGAVQRAAARRAERRGLTAPPARDAGGCRGDDPAANP